MSFFPLLSKGEAGAKGARGTEGQDGVKVRGLVYFQTRVEASAASTIEFSDELIALSFDPRFHQKWIRIKDISHMQN